MYEVCKQYVGLEQDTRRLVEYYSQVMGVLEERNMNPLLTTFITKNGETVLGYGCGPLSHWFEVRV